MTQKKSRDLKSANLILWLLKASCSCIRHGTAWNYGEHQPGPMLLVIRFVEEASRLTYITGAPELAHTGV
jgi:hypothetical protein